ncbi:QDE-2-interacting protein [Phlyctema vagabunda]|uniref:QDE-2-interacting protein n=1 Tax=Phlyctema vagabunda TaxID=108571 RepID=A0ABR4PY10_9HELO
METTPCSPTKLPGSKRRKFRIAADGGLRRVGHCLGIADSNGSPDAVLVCIDLEVRREERLQAGVPLVNEFGIATLDPRLLRSSAAAPPTAPWIRTQQFSTSNTSKDFHGCDCTDFNECLFVETHRVSQTELPATIRRCLRLPDDQSLDPSKLRDIIIVGHSVRSDLEILQRLGVEVRDVAPVLAIVDTHFIARSLSRNDGFAPAKGFSLGSLLTELGCPFKKSDLHNAGNDATFTLHLLLKLSIKTSEDLDLNSGKEEALERLRTRVQFELYDCAHWEPVRKALGFYAAELP